MYTSTATIPHPLLCQSSFRLHYCLPSSSPLLSFASHPASLQRLQPRGSLSLENYSIISPFFAPFSVGELLFPLSRPLDGRFRATPSLVVGALRFQNKEEDVNFRWRGREPFGDDGDNNKNGELGRAGRGRGRGASQPREDTKEFANTGNFQDDSRRLRHPRERRWLPPNPRKVYPSNLRYVPNPIYPKKKDVGDERQNSVKRDTWTTSSTSVAESESESESAKETYLRQLLKARSLNPKPSKSYIQEESKEDDNKSSVTSLPYAMKRRSVNSPETGDTNISNDEKALRQALKLRRQQTREVLRKHFMEASMSKTFSQLVVDSMPGFVDHILIQAVALKSQERYVTSTFVARAQACLAATQVAEIVKWMKHNHITHPRVGQLVDMKGKDLSILRERINFLKTNYVRGRDLGVVLTRHPVILDRPQEELCNIIQLLEDAGVRREWVGFVICRCPGVLALSVDELVDRISFFEGLGVRAELFGPMAFNFPACVGRFPLPEMQAKVEYLRSLGLMDASIGKAIATRPQLLACNIEIGWQRLVKYFKFLGIQDAGIQRIFCVHPSVFCMNLEKNIAPKVRFFRAIGIHESAIGQVIVDFPALLSYSMDRKIRPVVRFMLEEAGVKEEHIGKVIALRPQLIGTGLTLRLQPLVKFFRNQQLKREDVGRMVADFPMLLRYNLAIIESKFRFFKRAMKRPLEDLVSFPRYFSYSLEGRIKPRQQILKSNDLMLHLRYMLACNDEIFSQRVKAALERRSLGILSSPNQAIIIDQGTEEEELLLIAPEHTTTLTNAWVPNVWGALRGEDKDTEDFEVSAAWEEEDDHSDNELSAEKVSLLVRNGNDIHPYNNTSSNKKLAPQDGDSRDDLYIELDKENIEGFGDDEEEDDSIVDEDMDFLMKYCV